MKPINTKDKLPPNKTYVLVRYTGGNWADSDHQAGCVWKVAKFIRGLSTQDREQMEDCERKNIYRKGDQWGNNKQPYVWDEFGPGCLFGQDVDAWLPLPE